MNDPTPIPRPNMEPHAGLLFPLLRSSAENLRVALPYIGDTFEAAAADQLLAALDGLGRRVCGRESWSREFTLGRHQ